MKKSYLFVIAIAISFGLLTGCSGEKKSPAMEKAAKAKESVAKAVEKAPEQAAKIKEATTEAVKKTVEAAPEKMAEAKETATMAAEAVKEKVSEVVGSTEPAPEEAAPAKAAVSQETVRLGGSTYKARCVACHGIGGKGSAMAPALAGNGWITETGTADISKVIKFGRPGSAKRYKKFPLTMPAHSSMGDEELSALTHYLKSIN
jgi:mono/diheme cytochrome c family protein